MAQQLKIWHGDLLLSKQGYLLRRNVEKLEAWYRHLINIPREMFMKEIISLT